MTTVTDMAAVLISDEINDGTTTDVIADLIMARRPARSAGALPLCKTSRAGGPTGKQPERQKELRAVRVRHPSQTSESVGIWSSCCLSTAAEDGDGEKGDAGGGKSGETGT